MFLLTYLTFDVFPRNEFFGRRTARLILAAYSVTTAVLTLTPLVISRLTLQGAQAQPVPGPGIIFFITQQAGLLSASVITVYKKFRLARGLVKTQLKYIIAGVILSLSIILVCNFILVQVFKNSSLVFLGSVGTLFFTGSFSYAVVRHRLLNIRAVVARSVAFVLLLSTLTVIYIGAVLGVTIFIFKYQTTSILLQHSVYIGLIALLALTLQPLRRFFEHLTDRLFYRDRYESEAVLNGITKILASELILDHLLNKSLHEICHQLRIASGQYIIFDADRVYKTTHFGGPMPDPIPKSELAHLHHSTVIADELESGHRKIVMDQFGIRASLALRTKEGFIGFLLLGDKLSGDIYSTQDIEVLEILSGELAVAIQNAKSYEEISQFNQTLRQKIKQATYKLRTANEHLKELDQAKDDFISMASHQLRTPLTTIGGYLSMLSEGDAGKLTPRQAEYIGLAAESTNRMAHLISDMLNISRMEAGRFFLSIGPTDLLRVVREEIEQLQGTATKKGVKLIAKLPQTFPQVMVDSGKLREVVMNLVDNALYYTPKGTVTVTLAIDQNQIILKVIDTGMGVPKAAQHKLFGKFFRASNALSARPEGNGLGLYLVNHVVRDHGGTIIFESTEGQGSTFGFKLPLVLNQTVKNKEMKDANQASASPKA